MKRKFVRDFNLSNCWDVQVKFMGMWFPTFKYIIANSNETKENLVKKFEDKYVDKKVEYEF